MRGRALGRGGSPASSLEASFGERKRISEPKYSNKYQHHTFAASVSSLSMRGHTHIAAKRKARNRGS